MKVNIEIIERIDQLVDQRDLQVYTATLENIINELDMEGFDLQDIKMYFQLMLDEKLGKFDDHLGL